MLRIRISISRDRSAEMCDAASRRNVVPAFSMLPAGPAASPGTWAPSVVLHAVLAGVLLLRTAAPAVPAGGSGHNGTPLLLRLSGKTYYVSHLGAGQGLVFGKRLTLSGKRGSREEHHGGGPDLIVSVNRKHPKQSPVTVVREDIAPSTEVRESVQLPNLAVWTLEALSTVRPVPVEPGRRAVEAQPLHTVVTEVLAPPDFRLGQPNASAPVRAFMASTNPRQSSTVVVPAANAGGTDGLTDARASAGSAAGPGNPEAGGAAGSAGSKIARTGPGGRGPGGSTVPTTVSAGGNSVQPELTVAVSPAASASAPGVITIRRPETGNFDAVVVQTSGAELLDGSSHALSGKPVYTVYLPVGTRKDWILQYCLPTEHKRLEQQQEETSGPLVRLTADAPIEAPWPTLIQRVPVILPPGERYLILHGYVSAAGKFERLSVVRTNGSLDNYPGLIEAVSGWEFRPARRSTSPVAVEVLLAIPATGAA